MRGDFSREQLRALQHRVNNMLHRPRYCAKRLLRALRASENPLADDLRDVYFGHTHTTMSNYSYRGIRFHNTGATIHGIECALLPVRL